MQTFRSLRHRNYRLYFVGQMISLTGSWTQTTAVMWLAFQITKQSKWPAFLSVAMIGPTLLLGGWAGSLADRCRKHSLIIRTQIGFMTCASVLTFIVFAGAVNIWLLLALMCCHGVIQAIDLPSRLAFVPDLVEREDLINTVALNSVQFNVARAIGPAIASSLLVETGPGICFLLNAFSYLPVLVALLMMKGFRERQSHERPTTNESGFAVLRQKPRVLTVVLLAGWVAISGWPLLTLLPALAVRVLNSAAGGYGSMLSAVGIGALAAAFTAATFGSIDRQRRLLFAGLCSVCVALSALSQATNIFVASLCCGLFGYGMILFFATGQGVVQLGAADEHRGKVMGIWAMVLSGGTPLGNLVFGPAADEWGVKAIIEVQGCMMCLAVVAFLARLKLFRQTG